MNQNGNKRGGIMSFLSILIIGAMFAVGVYMIDQTVKTEQQVCDHVWNSGTITKEATCTDEGIETFLCRKCYFSKQEKIRPACSYFAIETGKEATCIAEGYSPKQQCNVCGKIKSSEIIPALGHDLIITEAKAATCTADGNTYGEKCSRCSYYVPSSIIEMLGHDNELIRAVEATCTEDGHEAYSHCNRCGFDEPHETYLSTGHIMNEVNQEATCVTGGQEGEKCVSCGYSTVTRIAPLWHDFRDTGTCSRCWETLTVENLKYIQNVSLEAGANGSQNLIFSCGEIPTSVNNLSSYQKLGMIFVEREELDEVKGVKNDKTNWTELLGDRAYSFKEMSDVENGKAVLEGIVFEKLNVRYVAIPCIANDLREEGGIVYYQYAKGVADSSNGYYAHTYSASSVAFAELQEATIEKHEKGNEVLSAERLAYLEKVAGAAIDQLNGKKAPEQTPSKLMLDNLFKSYIVRYKTSNCETYIDFEIVPKGLEKIVPITVITEEERNKVVAEERKLQVLYGTNVSAGDVTRYVLKDLNNGTIENGMTITFYIGGERFETTVFIKEY